MIGRLLGHSEVQTTDRYAHLAADWVRDSAVCISESIAADILAGYPRHLNHPFPEVRGRVAEDEATERASAFPVQQHARTSWAR